MNPSKRAFDLLWSTIKHHGIGTGRSAIAGLAERGILVTWWAGDHRANFYINKRVEIECDSQRWSVSVNTETAEMTFNGISEESFTETYDVAGRLEKLMGGITSK